MTCDTEGDWHECAFQENVQKETAIYADFIAVFSSTIPCEKKQIGFKDKIFVLLLTQNVSKLMAERTFQSLQGFYQPVFFDI